MFVSQSPSSPPPPSSSSSTLHPHSPPLLPLTNKPWSSKDPTAEDNPVSSPDYFGLQSSSTLPAPAPVPAPAIPSAMNGHAHSSSSTETQQGSAIKTKAQHQQHQHQQQQQVVVDNPRIKTKNEGFFQRSRRKLSATLPSFNGYAGRDREQDWREAEKLGRGRWHPRGGGVGGGAIAGTTLSQVKTLARNIIRRFKFVLIVLGLVLFLTTIASKIGVRQRYRANSAFGGGGKFVIILAANEGGGVMEWKGARDWAIERDSIKNKRQYADRWGYHLEIADMSTKKRYAHEWRESWEKVDAIRNAMAKYPKAEWFWWLDLHTFIMEPSRSLQQQLFNHLDTVTYRDINRWNPLNISHPPQGDFLDPVTASPSGDNLTSSIDMIIPQDCSGFNLGSFFTRRSAFAERLLDLWWDPVLYEQKHMEWEHKEQDALEHLYKAQPYVRSRIAFTDLRRINSFPPGACPVENKEEKERNGESIEDARFHYSEKDRDFLINMAGCEWGRNCWDELYHYREKSMRLNRSRWQKLRDWWADAFGPFKRRWYGEEKRQEG